MPKHRIFFSMFGVQKVVWNKFYLDEKQSFNSVIIGILRYRCLILPLKLSFLPFSKSNSYSIISEWKWITFSLIANSFLMLKFSFEKKSHQRELALLNSRSLRNARKSIIIIRIHIIISIYWPDQNENIYPHRVFSKVHL